MVGSGTEKRLGKTSADEVLGWGWQQFRDHLELLYPFGVFVLVSFMLELRIELFTWLFDVEDGLTLRVDTDRLADTFSPRIADVLVPALEDVAWLLVLSVLGILLLTVLVLLVAVGIAFLVAADVLDSRERSQVDRTLVAVRRLPAFFAGTVAALVLVAGGLVLLVVPGVYLAVRFILAGPAIVVDGCGPIEGLRAGWNASGGQFLFVFSFVVLGVLALVLAALVPIVGELVVGLVILPVFSLGLAYAYIEGENPHGT